MEQPKLSEIYPNSFNPEWLVETNTLTSFPTKFESKLEVYGET